MDKMLNLPRRMIGVVLAFFTFVSAVSWASQHKAVVLLDEGHGQHFSFEGKGALDLSRLKEEIIRAGATTRTGRGRFTEEGLRHVDAVVISGAFSPITPREVEALLAFVRRGGRIFIALHIGPPLYGLLDRLGVSVSNGVVRERENVIGSNGLDFMVVDLGPWPILEGLGHFNVYGCWALRPTRGNIKSVARTSPRAWVDLNRNRTLDRRDAVSRFSVAVHGVYARGEVVVFGDDALFQNAFIKGQNLELARRISRWLVGKKGLPPNLDDFI